MVASGQRHRNPPKTVATMSFIDAFNNSKIAWGIGTIVMQLGARFVVGDLTDMQNKVLASALFKRVVLCFMIFISTRDIICSIVLTMAIHAVLYWLFNEKSNLCIVPKNMRQDDKALVTPAQYAAAVEVVQRYQLQSVPPSMPPSMPLAPPASASLLAPHFRVGG